MKLPLRLGYFEGIAADNGMGREVDTVSFSSGCVFCKSCILRTYFNDIEREKLCNWFGTLPARVACVVGACVGLRVDLEREKILLPSTG